MSEDEREILRMAREKAIEVLTTSSAKAEKVADEAEADAVALLLRQQELAGRVLAEQEDAATRGAAPGEGDALIEAHRTAAELLAIAEEELANSLHGAKANAAVDVLMAGQREAAAILLDAWMRVTEGRPSGGNRAD